MSDSRRLAQELYEIRALALSHATSPQVGSSSVDGDGLVFRDGEGNDLGRIGGGEDGMEVEYLYGPKPYQPSAPIVSADANLISVRWDGLWVGGEDETDPGIVGAGSLDRVEVHVSSDEFFVPDPINSFAGVVPVTPEGGVAVVGPLAEAGDWYVVLMARGKDGQYGAPSERVHVVTTVGLMENELFGLALRAGEAMDSADGKNSVYYGDEEPQPTPRLDENGDPVLDDDGNPLFNEFTEGDIWFGEGNMPHVWSDTDGWVSAADERVDAIQSVVDELEGDLDAVRESADGKSKTFYRPTEPPAVESSEGDLWFDTSAEGGNRAHRFTGGVWVSVADQRVQAVQDAMDALESDVDAVRTSVDGKNRITQSIDAPPSQYDGAVGDRWERMSSMGSGGSLISNWRWNGDVWVSTIISDAVLGNVDAAKIGTGYLDAQRIKAGTIAADRLVVGISQNLVVDSKFKNAEISAARANNGSPNTWDVVESGAETWFRSKAGASITSRFFYLTTDGISTNPVTRISVDPTSVWHMSVEVSISSSAQAITHLAASCVAYSADGTARFLTKDFTRSDTGGRRINPGEGWVRLEATYDWSEYDGVVTVAPRVYVVSGGGGPDGWTWFRNPFIGEKTGSTLIEDGAITTDKIAAGAITAESGVIGSLDAGKIVVGEMDGARIKAGSIQADLALIESSVGSTLIRGGAITTDKIQAGAVTTEKITAGGIDAGVITTGELRGELIRAQSIAASALAATAIDGKTITGATVRTAAAGARVEMNSSGLYVKNQFGTNTVSMQNGELSVSGGTITGGTVRTSASGARVQLDVTGLKAFNPSGDETFSISSNTGTVNMEGNLRQTNEYGRFDVGPTVFASGADGRGTPGIAFTRHSKPSGVAHPAGIALRQSGDGTGSFLQVQSEGGTAGWSFLNLATPGASAHTGLHRWFTGDDRSSFNINGDGNTYISTVNQAGKGNVWLQTYVRGRDHSQTRFSMQNSGRIFASTYVGSNPDARTSMLDMASEGTWLIAGSGTSATSSRNLNLNAYGDAYMRAYGRGNDPALDAYVGAQQDGGAVIASAGGSEWIGVGYTGTSPGGDGIYVRTRGDLTMYMGRWVAPNINTGSGTDLIITASNYIGKKSSSRRYKIAEEPIEYTLPGIEDALLGMEVKTWFDRQAAERVADVKTANMMSVDAADDLADVDPLRRIPGVVAEDLDAAGLGMFVVYNEDGSPESVMYDRLGVALVPAVKALRDRVNELEEKIGELWNG